MTNSFHLRQSSSSVSPSAAKYSSIVQKWASRKLARLVTGSPLVFRYRAIWRTAGRSDVVQKSLGGSGAITAEEVQRVALHCGRFAGLSVDSSSRVKPEQPGKCRDVRFPCRWRGSAAHWQSLPRHCSDPLCPKRLPTKLLCRRQTER
jgi:hypothetical protein